MNELENIGKLTFKYTLSVVGGKWKMYILFLLSTDKIMRYGELKKSLDGITHKILSSHLKELEMDGMIIRKEYPQVPPKVEYSLSPKGISIIPILEEMCHWGSKNN